jgi:ubiquinol-cytochrome c reductase cytochrome b subunit
LLVVFLVMHIAIFRRHGIHAHDVKRAPETTFWPDQVLKDAVACLAVLCVVLFFVFKPVIFGQPIGDHPGDVLGADLGAPADPANQYSAARPEWYFLFLFQFLKYFPGESEIYGAIVIPAVLMGVLFLMPIVGHWRLGHVFNVLFLFCILIGVGLLTAQAWYDDNMARYAWKLPFWDEKTEAAKRAESEAYLGAVRDAEHSAERATELARAPAGIPQAGAASLLRTDPKTQGPRLFTQYCANCHDHVDANGQGIAAEKKSAPNLYGFASREWLAGLLDPQRIDGPEYFGLTKHRTGDMAGFVKDSLPDHNKDDVRKAIMALSAEAGLPSQKEADERDAHEIAVGRKLIEELTCTDCHKFRNVGDLGTAPDLTGYGSRAWLTAFIANPAHERFYGKGNDRMPAFAASKNKAQNQLSPQNLSLIVRWLRGDWHEDAE